MKRVLFSILLCCHFSAQAILPSAQYNLVIDKASQSPRIDKLKADPAFSFQSLRSSGVSSYDEFLDLLKTTKPGFYDNVVLVHSSGSLQPSSLESPRVLLYNGNMVFSFSESENAKKTIEVMEFNDKNLTLDFHEIVFEENKKPRFVKNPQKCTTCHGSPARPIWEAYDFWPTAFGSFAGMTLSETEKQAFSGVVSNSPTKLRSLIQKADLKAGIDRFTAFLSQINFLIGFHQVQNDLKVGDLKPFRFYLLGMFSCTDMSYNSELSTKIIYKRFLPESVEKKLPISFQQVYNDVVESNAQVKEMLFGKYLNVFPDGKKPFVPAAGLSLDRLRDGEIAIASQVEFIFANFGLSLKDFTLSQRKDNYILSTPNIFEFDLQKTLIFTDPELLSETQYTVFDDDSIGGFYQFDCNDLEQKSKTELEKYFAGKKVSPVVFSSALVPSKSESTMAKCIRCHSSNQQTLSV